jgi:hypothetical protein
MACMDDGLPRATVDKDGEAAIVYDSQEELDQWPASQFDAVDALNQPRSSGKLQVLCSSKWPFLISSRRKHALPETT